MNIKYEKLSSDLKNEIDNYHKVNLKSNSQVTFDETINLWFENNFDAWLEKQYDNTDIEQKREYGRIDVELPVKVVETLIDGIDHKEVEVDLIGTISNISRGGLYFYTDTELEKLSIIKVTIDMSVVDNKLGEINALAMVVRVEKHADSKYGVGIMFSSIDDNNNSAIETNIFKYFAYFLYNK